MLAVSRKKSRPPGANPERQLYEKQYVEAIVEILECRGCAIWPRKGLSKAKFSAMRTALKLEMCTHDHEVDKKQDPEGDVKLRAFDRILNRALQV